MSRTVFIIKLSNLHDTIHFAEPLKYFLAVLLFLGLQVMELGVKNQIRTSSLDSDDEIRPWLSNSTSDDKIWLQLNNDLDSDQIWIKIGSH